MALGKPSGRQLALIKIVFFFRFIYVTPLANQFFWCSGSSPTGPYGLYLSLQHADSDLL